MGGGGFKFPTPHLGKAFFMPLCIFGNENYLCQLPNFSSFTGVY